MLLEGQSLLLMFAFFSLNLAQGTTEAPNKNFSREMSVAPRNSDMDEKTLFK